jgi:hypothetical protein
MSTPASPRPYPDVLYYQRQHRPPRQKRPHGRWIWAVSGMIVICLMIAWVGTMLGRPNVIRALPEGVETHTVDIRVPLTHLNVDSYGGDITVAGGGRGTRVTEQVFYDPQAGPAPAVVNSVSGGQLALTVPACQTENCVARFTVTVPSAASVTAVTDGGNLTVSDVAGAVLDSDGGRVSATSVGGPLTVTSEGGDQSLAGISGSLTDESGGGRVVAAGITGSSATIITDGGPLVARRLSVRTAVMNSGGSDARVEFATAPATADIATDGGRASVLIPGGPYAVTADSGGANEVVKIPTSASARATLTVTTGGGPLVIEPASDGGQPPQ